LDDFKKVNDTYGHEVGDMVLVRVVDSIRSVIREDDRIFRWGGEEFVIFTKGIAVDNLDLFIENVLKAVENSKCSRSEMDIRITVSLGATCFIDSDESVDAALKRADDGLYESKRNGKNRGTVV
ncbi:MAG: GGDEF domain-containing protein, partial [Eubacteriales bacterium]|nr:GGDEF domain-containing protein [Eubacteriales bacterium]